MGSIANSTDVQTKVEEDESAVKSVEKVEEKIEEGK